MTDVDRAMTEIGPGAQRLREMIHQLAEELGVPVAESLKWGQPSFAAPKGTPLRLGAVPGGYAIYAHCQTSVIREFAAEFPDFDIDGTRAVRFSADERPPELPLRWLIQRALLYHQRGV